MINLNKERRRCVMNDINLITAKTKKETSSLRTFLNYVIPSITAMWVFSIYTMVDGLFVANYVGHEALAAVNIAMPTINLIFALKIGV